MRHLLAALLCLTLAPAAHAQSALVFAAASLKEALDEVASTFAMGRAGRVDVSYAASSALARQIERGAPADIFISADTDWIDYVEQRGLAAPGTRRNLLANDLVLIAPAASQVRVKLAPGVDLAAALGKGRLAMADPESVPAGKYARAALTSLGAWRHSRSSRAARRLWASSIAPTRSPRRGCASSMRFPPRLIRPSCIRWSC